MDDAYAILGLSRDSTAGEIRRAFRRMALAHHPDRNPGDPHAAARFVRVVAAYRALTGRPVVARPRAAPVGPPPGRYACAGCGEQFAIEGTCFRCDLPVVERGRHRASSETPTDPKVEAWVAELERRAVSTPPSWMQSVPVGGLLVGLFVVAAVGAYVVGPVGVALLFAGFATYLVAGEVHRRAVLALAAR